MPDSDIESRMRRAISSSVAEQWRKTQAKFTKDFIFGNLDSVANDPNREKILEKIAEWFQDPRILFLKSWDGESSFREELFENPHLIFNPSFMMDWNDYRNKEMSYSLMEKNDPLSNLAMLEIPESEGFKTEKDMIAYYFSYYANLGPERSGRLEEVIGPMGSGKSNYLTWKAIRALQRGYVVFTNFNLKNVPQTYHSNWHRISNLLELLKGTIELKIKGYNGIIFWILDEQGRVRGGSSVTRSTREARYLSELLTMIRKFGVFLTRARQVDNVPEDQRGWISQIVSKNTKMPELVTIENLSEGQTYEKYEFTIPNMAQYYDTNEPSEMDYNVDVEEMQKWMTIRAKEIDPLAAIAEYLHISQNIVEKQTQKLVKELKKKAKPNMAGKNPNSLKALEEINRKRKEEKMKRQLQSQLGGAGNDKVDNADSDGGNTLKEENNGKE